MLKSCFLFCNPKKVVLYQLSFKFHLNFHRLLEVIFVTSCFASFFFYVLCFVGITKEPGFISKRRVPYHDPQISKSLKWNGALSENDVVVSPEPEVPETPKSEAEQEDVNQEKVLSLEASTFPKRGRSHSADSRAEGTPDAVEKHEDVATNHILVNENVDQEHSTNLLPEHVDNGVGTIRTVVLISKA